MKTHSDMKEWLTAIKMTRDLNGLDPVLKNWVKLIKDYCRMDSFEHNPWCYNERASIGTLAGAAWRTRGWLATEEYCTTKIESRRKSGVEPNSERHGRCDLLLETQTTTYAIEAKHAWQPISKGSSTMLKRMQGALQDAALLTKDEGDRRIAATFTAPYLTLSRNVASGTDISDVRRQIHKWLDENIHGRFGNYAYVFPRDVSQYTNKVGNRIFPGVVLTLQSIRSRH